MVDAGLRRATPLHVTARGSLHVDLRWQPKQAARPGKAATAAQLRVKTVQRDGVMASPELTIAGRVQPIEGKPVSGATVEVCLRVPETKLLVAVAHPAPMCEHLRSIIRSRMRTMVLSQLWPQVSQVVRDTVLGPKPEGNEARKGRFFADNGMLVSEVEILQAEIQDSVIADLMKSVQRESVMLTIGDRQAQEKLSSQTLRTEIDRQNSDLLAAAKQREASIAEALRKLKHEELLQAQAQAAVAERSAVQPQLVEALTALGDKALLGEIAHNMDLVSLFRGKEAGEILTDIVGGSRFVPALMEALSVKPSAKTAEPGAAKK